MLNIKTIYSVKKKIIIAKKKKNKNLLNKKIYIIYLYINLIKYKKFFYFKLY